MHIVYIYVFARQVHNHHMLQLYVDRLILMHLLYLNLSLPGLLMTASLVS